MITFIDTSAFYGLLDKDDANHELARDAWVALLAEENLPVTSNYVLVESFALIQHRMGLAAIRAFQEDILPVVRVEWVAASLHKAAVSALLAASKRNLSLVDCVSFEVMRATGIKTVFAFDPHFSQQGFKIIP